MVAERQQADRKENLVRECPTCIKTKANRAEPMISSQLPERPFQKVGIDLFK